MGAPPVAAFAPTTAKSRTRPAAAAGTPKYRFGIAAPPDLLEREERRRRRLDEKAISSGNGGATACKA
jgi:hypothetical protein